MTNKHHNMHQINFFPTLQRLNLLSHKPCLKVKNDNSIAQNFSKNNNPYFGSLIDDPIFTFSIFPISHCYFLPLIITITPSVFFKFHFLNFLYIPKKLIIIVIFSTTILFLPIIPLTIYYIHFT